MHPVRALIATAALALFAAIAPASVAFAGKFTIATCQSDRLHFSARAFTGDSASRGMTSQRLCSPYGHGPRGVITGNRVGRGAIRAGATARISISAPPGTWFTTLTWVGATARPDCRYTIQMTAVGTSVRRAGLPNYVANHDCTKPNEAIAAGARKRRYNIRGATRIVQKVVCRGKARQHFCSVRRFNGIVTSELQVGVVDYVPPVVRVLPDTPLGAGAWVHGSQPLNYTAVDNVGVRKATAIAGGLVGGGAPRPCAFAAPTAYATGVPCLNGLGRITVDTSFLHEGTQKLTVQGQDTAGNLGYAPTVTARIDNTPPDRANVTSEGGEQWRNVNDFTLSWTNPVQLDAAPIVAVFYKLCNPGTGSCLVRRQAKPYITSLPLAVQAPGQWTVSLWRQDAAGNATQIAASVPVTLRYDPEPPKVAFAPLAPADPTLVTVPVTDNVSGIADGTIEIGRLGSGIWQTLATKRVGSRLVARINDAAFPPGNYVLRAIAHDQARNESSTMQLANGQPMIVTLPIRITPSMLGGIVRERVVRRVVRRHGKRRVVRTHEVTVERSAVVRLGRRAQVVGRLTDRAGRGLAGAQVEVWASSITSPAQLVTFVRTDSDGNYTYTSAATSSRTLLFVYRGSPTVLPSQNEVSVAVRANSSLRVSRRRVLNGQRVMFSGRVRSVPVPAGGKLIQLEVRLPGRWQTFRTTHTDASGRWAVPYRFTRTRGVQHYRFRLELPPEAGYPFVDGTSRSVSVRVRGR
jgi:hypothetical protein